MPGDRRLALVFSGGGAKGAFGVGALRAMTDRFPKLKWQVVSGTSTGGLIAPFASIASADRTALDLLQRFYLDARKKDIVDSNLGLGGLAKAIVDLPEGLYNFDPLEKTIGKALTPARRRQLLDGDVTTIVNAVDLQTGALALWTQRKNVAALRQWFKDAKSKGGVGAWFFPEGDLVKAMLSSSAIPGAIDPQEHARGADARPCKNLEKEQIVDGGVVDLAPLRAAIAAGATDIVAVFMSPRVPKPVCKRAENVLEVALRAVDLLTDEIGRNDVESARRTTDLRGLAEVLLANEAGLPAPVRTWLHDPANRERVAALAGKRDIRVEVIEPPFPLGETLDFDSDVGPDWPTSDAGAPRRNVMRARFDHGVAAAGTAMDAADGRLAAMLRAFAPA